MIIGCVKFSCYLELIKYILNIKVILSLINYANLFYMMIIYNSATFRHYYYSFNFLLLSILLLSKFIKFISVTYGKAKLKPTVSHAQLMLYWSLIFFFKYSS